MYKPANEFFEAAVATADAGLTFDDVLFVTENEAHVVAARTLGMHAIQVRPPGGGGGDVASLIELLPHAREFVGTDCTGWSCVPYFCGAYVAYVSIAPLM